MMRHIKNPLFKRIPRELKSDIFKYFAVAIFMIFVISFISGALTTGDSMQKTYNASFEKYNIEYGHFVLKKEAEPDAIKKLEAGNVRIYPDYYIETSVGISEADKTPVTEADSFAAERSDKKMKAQGSTLRLFTGRENGPVNGIDLLEGRYPKHKDEIGMDRLYCKNNDIKIGDTVISDGRTLKVTGIIALPDYSSMFQDMSSMMFDSVKFGVGYVSPETFDAMKGKNLKYSYAWVYKKGPASNGISDDNSEEKKLSDDFVPKLYDAVTENGNSIEIYLPRYANQAITFTGNDMGSDRNMYEFFFYIVTVIMAFVFAVTLNHNIDREARVIGTIRASGYSRGEIFAHYITIPIIIMIFSAVLGNIIGSVLFEKIVVSMYYNSYDLTGYQSYFFPDVLIRTTIVPVVLLVIVLSFSLWKKLNMPTLKFLQNDLKKQTREKAMRLPRWSFIRRFRMRVIIENRSNYITLFIGILFAALLLIFGITSLPLLNNYSENAIKYKIAPYQYFLKNSVEVNTDKAEKFSAISLKSISDFFAAEDITVYGIRDDSRFYKGPELKEDEIVVSSDLSAKYHVGTGDTFTMKDPYSSKMYSFKVSGIFHQPSFICVYMRNKDFCKAFEKEIEDQMSADDALNMFITKLSGQTYDDYFNGYFSDIDLKNTYIDEENISIVITEVELTRVVRQMKISMGSIFQMFSVFSIVLCILLIYLLTKTVIEKSSLSIAMLKILGYKEAEIARVYIISGMIATAVSAVISLSLMYFLVGYMWIVFLKDYSGWFHFSCSLTDMAGMFLMIMGAYVIVSMILYRKIRRVPMGDVLKDVM